MEAFRAAKRLMDGKNGWLYGGLASTTAQMNIFASMLKDEARKPYKRKNKRMPRIVNQITQNQIIYFVRPRFVVPMWKAKARKVNWILGAALAGLTLFMTGFLNEAGSDAYHLLKTGIIDNPPIEITRKFYGIYRIPLPILYQEGCQILVR